MALATSNSKGTIWLAGGLLFLTALNQAWTDDEPIKLLGTLREKP